MKTPKHTGIRTFEIVQYVTGYLGEGDIDTWPAQIQDQVMAALEKKAKEVELPLAIIHSLCAVEPADDEGEPEKFYVRVVASEVVVADERLVKNRIVRGSKRRLN